MEQILPDLTDFTVAVIIILAAILVSWLSGILLNYFAKRVFSKTATTIDDVVITAVTGPVRLAIIVAGFQLAVALAAQETLSDIISGFMIMLDQPFTIGDRVEIQDIDTWGDVEEIGLRSTRILTRDNRMVTVPNSVIGKGLVVNYSDPSTVYRV